MKFSLIYLFLLVSLFIFQGCQTVQTTEISAVNLQSADVSDDEIKDLFIKSGLGEGDGNLQKLMALPRERVVAVVQKLKDSGEYKLKSAYFLWKLGVDSAANEKLIVDSTNSRDFNFKFDAFSYLGAIIGEGKKEYLPIIFKITPEADNALAEGVHGLFMGEIIDSPKIFLQYLSKEPFKIRKSVYELVSYTEKMYGKERFEKIISNLKEMTKDAEVKKIAEEFLKEINKKTRKA